jgi:Fur family zinc uptake transcriptional regulator
MPSAIRATQPEALNEVEAKIVRHLKRSTKFLGAYDIRTALAIRYPNTVYRALDRLSELGLVHRVKSQNAFIACDQPTNAHTPGFMICGGCGTVQEFDLHAIRPPLRSEAARHNFEIDMVAIELTGRCRRCAAKQWHSVAT